MIKYGVIKKQRKNILITGASVGLGLEVARLLIEKDEYNLFLTARASSLTRFIENGITPSKHIHLEALDVTDASMRLQLIQKINETAGGVDILINNAGFTFRSVLEDVSDNDQIQQMETNFRAPMQLIRLCLPYMRDKRAGQIINISSVGGMMAMPTMGIYSASKHALEGASESLWYEVRPWNIKVTLLSPGFINSKGFEKVRKTWMSNASMENSSSTYFEHYKNMEGFVERIMKKTPSTSYSVAKKVLKVIEAKNPPLRVTATWDALVFKLMKAVIPQRLYHAILYYSLPGIRKWGRRPKITRIKGQVKDEKNLSTVSKSKIKTKAS